MKKKKRITKFSTILSKVYCPAVYKTFSVRSCFVFIIFLLWILFFLCVFVSLNKYI